MSNDSAGVDRLLTDLFGPSVTGVVVSVGTVVVISDGYVANVGRWAAVSAAWTPTIRMGYSVNHRRAVSHWVIAIQVGIIVTASMVIIIAVASRVVAPLWVAGPNEDGGGE